MTLLELDLGGPALNLAADEALLDACEAGQGDEVLRFWEATSPFVVVGYGNRVGAEVNVEACQAMAMPVFRRCSGGGTVVQGPGCLSYALVLRVDRAAELVTVTGTNAWVMHRNALAISGLLGREVEVEGVTDLALGGRKFSGNAQRRRRRSVLFHGTFLLSARLEAMEEVLRMPTRIPDYRADRGHRAFVRNLGVDAGDVRAALAKVWSARPGPARLDLGEVARLVRDCYGRAEWNLRL